MDKVIPLRTERQLERVIDLSSLAFEEEVLHEVVIRPVKKLRTHAQNDRYHAMLTILASATGNSHNALHEFFKMEFLGLQTFAVGDKMVSRPRSTTGLSRKEFADYVDQVEAWIAEQNF